MTDNDFDYYETFSALDDKYGNIAIDEYSIRDYVDDGNDLNIDEETLNKYGHNMIAVTGDEWGDNVYVIANSDLFFNKEFQSKWSGDSRSEFWTCCNSLILIEPEKITASFLQSLYPTSLESEAA